MRQTDMDRPIKCYSLTLKRKERLNIHSLFHIFKSRCVVIVIITVVIIIIIISVTVTGFAFSFNDRR
jgi:hypothetical protein